MSNTLNSQPTSKHVGKNKRKGFVRDTTNTFVEIRTIRSNANDDYTTSVLRVLCKSDLMPRLWELIPENDYAWQDKLADDLDTTQSAIVPLLRKLEDLRLISADNRLGKRFERKFWIKTNKIVRESANSS